MSEVITFRGLYAAYRDCRRRKRRTANAQRYEMRLLDNLYDTLAALQSRSYSPHRAMRFVAQKPKAREIHAADFRDRVVHHWLVPRLEALFEPIFIHDVYSNRVGKGTHNAVDRLQSFMHSVGNDGWFLQLDIANFFNSIDRPILFKLVQQRLRKAVGNGAGGTEAATLRWLTHTILKHDASSHSVYRGNPRLLQRVPPHKQLGNAGEHKGLPIGNLTSQFFANVYLNPLDQFIKHILKCRHYLRYVDDFVLLADNPQTLLAWRGQIVDFLRDELELELKALAEPKPVTAGADFLGYITRPHYRLVRRRVVGSLHEKLQAFQLQIVHGNAYSGYTLSLQPAVMAPLQVTLASYRGHFKHANSYRLMQQIRRTFPWLDALFVFPPSPLAGEGLGVRGIPDPANITGYQSQTRFFRQHYPDADLHIQRGMEIDVVKGGGGDILRADIREYGYLKGGLKRRIVYRLIIKPGVELCPN